MSIGCRTSLSTCLLTIDPLPLTLKGSVRQYAVSLSSRSRRQTSYTFVRNSYGLRNKIEHYLRMKNLEAAERELKRTRLDGSVFSWNLVIKYYAKLGKYDEAERIYQLVTAVPCSIDLILDEKVWNRIYHRHLCATSPCC